MKKFDHNEFRKTVQHIIKEWSVPGMAVGIVNDKDVIFAEGFGYRDVKKKEKVTTSTMFEIASCTKAFCTASMALLVEQKKLDWDKPLREYMPEFKMKDPFASERITPRDIVCHRSGLPRHDSTWYRSSASRAELMERIRFLEPNKDFRSYYQYQNLMFLTAGMLIEKVSGMTWDEFVKKNFFEPLGMNRTNTCVNELQKSGNYSKPYMLDGNRVREIGYINWNPIGAGGNINSCIDDMVNWLRMHINRGKFNKKQIISADALKETHKPHIVIPDEITFKEEMSNSTYCLGWSGIVYRGNQIIAHGGSLDGFISRVSFMPDKKIGIVVLCNLECTNAENDVCYSAYDRLLGLDLLPWTKRLRAEYIKNKKKDSDEKKKTARERVKGTKPSHPLQDYTGEYSNDGYGKLFVLKNKDNMELIYNDYKFKMKHFHYDTFDFIDLLWKNTRKANFITDTKGKISSVMIKFEPNASEIVFKKTEKK